MATLVLALVAGALFGSGLAIATMVRPEVVLAFLRWRDMGLLLVLGGAVSVTLVAYRVLPRVLRKPLAAERFAEHPARLDRRTVVGAALFGIGWGVSGVCPAPALAGLGGGNAAMLWALAGLFAGAYAHGRLLGRA